MAHIFTTAVAQWLMSEGRWFDPSWGASGFFVEKNHSDQTIALGSTQPLTEMSTESISWG